MDHHQVSDENISKYAAIFNQRNCTIDKEKQN